MNRSARFLLVLALSLVSACAPGVQQGAITPGATDPVRNGTPLLRPPTPQFELLLQYHVISTYWFPEQREPGGNVPRFSMFADGRLVYVESGENGEQAMEVRLSTGEAGGLVEQALALGLERLKTHTDSCPPPDFADQSCLADGNLHIYRFRIPEASPSARSPGELREVAIYEHFANDLETHQALKEFLGGYRHPQARPFQPEQAILFVIEPPDPSVAPEGGRVRDWPFDPEWLATDQAGEWLWSRPLQGAELQQALEVFGSNMGEFYFPHKGGYYRAVLAPWIADF